MSQQLSQEKNYRLAAALTVAVFCMGQIPGSIDAAISKITEYFGLSSTSGLYVTTVASLVSVAFSILLGFIAGKKVGFKALILFCATVELISSIAPFFTSNFIVLIFLRGFFGVGFGGMQSLENTVAAKLISPEKRASILGIGTFFGFGMNCLLQFVGGVLADNGWNYVFLNHLFLIIPYVIILFGCTRLDFGDGDDRKPDTAAASANPKLPVCVFQMWPLLFFVGVFIAPLLIGCSFLSNPINPSASVAGIVAVCFSIGCMAGGLISAPLFGRLKRLALPFFLLLIAAGSIGCAATRSIVVLCIMIFMAGIGFAATQATTMAILGIYTPSSRIAFVSAILMALFNFGMFLSSPYEAFIGTLTGDSLYMPIYIGAVILVLLAFLYGIFSPLRQAPPQD